jgi:hypothetical protein
LERVTGGKFENEASVGFDWIGLDWIGLDWQQWNKGELLIVINFSRATKSEADCLRQWEYNKAS